MINKKDKQEVIEHLKDEIPQIQNAGWNKKQIKYYKKTILPKFMRVLNPLQQR